MARRVPVDIDELVEEVLADHVESCVVRRFGPVLPEDHRELELPAVVAEYMCLSWLQEQPDVIALAQLFSELFAYLGPEAGSCPEPVSELVARTARHNSAGSAVH